MTNLELLKLKKLGLKSVDLCVIVIPTTFCSLCSADFESPEESVSNQLSTQVASNCLDAICFGSVVPFPTKIDLAHLYFCLPRCVAVDFIASFHATRVRLRRTRS
jgi:hypothetical protein